MNWYQKHDYFCLDADGRMSYLELYNLWLLFTTMFLPKGKMVQFLNNHINTRNLEYYFVQGLQVCNRKFMTVINSYTSAPSGFYQSSGVPHLPNQNLSSKWNKHIQWEFNQLLKMKTVGGINLNLIEHSIAR
jgi:hypothetical protein